MKAKWHFIVTLIHISYINNEVECLSHVSHSSAGKEFACNAGDPGLIPELGRSPGEVIDYPLQYLRASLVS